MGVFGLSGAGGLWSCFGLSGAVGLVSLFGQSGVVGLWSCFGLGLVSGAKWSQKAVGLCSWLVSGANPG